MDHFIISLPDDKIETWNVDILTRHNIKNILQQSWYQYWPSKTDSNFTKSNYSPFGLWGPFCGRHQPFSGWFRGSLVGSVGRSRANAVRMMIGPLKMFVVEALYQPVKYYFSTLTPGRAIPWMPSEHYPLHCHEFWVTAERRKEGKGGAMNISVPLKYFFLLCYFSSLSEILLIQQNSNVIYKVKFLAPNTNSPLALFSFSPHCNPMCIFVQ